MFFCSSSSFFLNVFCESHFIHHTHSIFLSLRFSTRLTIRSFLSSALSTFFHVLRTGLSLANPVSEPLVISSAIPYILLCFWFSDKRVPLHQQPLSVCLSIYSTYASFAQHRLKHQYVCSDLFFRPYPSYLPRNHTLTHNTRSLFGRQLTCVSLSQRH